MVIARLGVPTSLGAGVVQQGVQVVRPDLAQWSSLLAHVNRL